MEEKSIHNKYVEKIKVIGDSMGFDTTDYKTPLGTLDCVWRTKSSHERVNGLPVVAFEVICSENQKKLKGSMMNLMAARPALAVFVFIKSYIRTVREGDEWLNRLLTFQGKMEKQLSGIIKAEVWDEAIVDEMWEKLRKRS
jgi:hypothetical protein